MSVPLIGITTYDINDENEYYISAFYVEGVRRAGGIPVLLPPGEARLDRLYRRLDGLILTGGGDIDPVEFQQEAHPTVSGVQPERDRLELTLARYALTDATPTLGICRGMQVLTVAAGGTLIQHLQDEVGDAVIHRNPPQMVPHPVAIDRESRLASLMGRTEVTVPSWHHQAPAEAPEGWTVTAYAPDGIIEAMELRYLPYMIAVQWHPERALGDPEHFRLFQALVEAATRKRSSDQAFQRSNDLPHTT